MAQNDQPRPDLDAAIDAVLPALTAVSDEAAAASLRRTRIALAERADTRRASGWGWGFAAAAMAGVVVLTTVSLWPRRAAAPTPDTIVERRPVAPAVVPSSPAPSAPPAVAPIIVPPRVIVPEPYGRALPPVAATSAPRVDETPRPDPLIALVRAVQQIPDEAWERSAALAAGPVSVPDVSFSPIDVAPLETPPIADAPVEPLAPGEP
jgi:hypothetical protein